jgi:hypothetical protein
MKGKPPVNSSLYTLDMTTIGAILADLIDEVGESRRYRCPKDMKKKMAFIRRARRTMASRKGH